MVGEAKTENRDLVGLCPREVQMSAILASLVATESGPTGNGCQVPSQELECFLEGYTVS